MKGRQKLWFLVSLSLLVTLISMSWVSVSAQEGTDLIGPEAGFVPDELIVGLKGPGSANALAVQVGGEVSASLDVLNAHLITLPPSPDLSAAEQQLEQAIATLQANAEVAWAEPNYVGHIVVEPVPAPLMLTPNDPNRGLQWALNSDRLNMYNAWNRTTGSPSGTKAIAILDTGADMDHPDLSGKLLTGLDWDFVNNDATPGDDHGHGSHCAGIAAASTNNATGIAGVAWQNKIIALKVCNAGGACTAWNVAQAIVHAVQKKAAVISMSLGWSQPSMVMRAAADFAWRGNVVVVAAAGNSNSYEPSYPAAFDSVISVASTNYSDSRSSFSTYHDTVEVSAPGGTGYPMDADDIYSCNQSGGYTYMAGTSMSTPAVAGAIALYRSLRWYTPAARARACLYVGVDDKGAGGWDVYYGWGRLDVVKYLNCRPGGRKVLIDNTHSNVGYSANDFRYDRFDSFADDLEAQGYLVDWTQSVGLTASSLAGRDILILADPHAAYTASELSAITSWVRESFMKKVIAFCEWAPFSSNSALNTLLSQTGSGIQCAYDEVLEPSQYDQYNYWPIINHFTRSQRENTSVLEVGLYAGTSLNLSSPAVSLAQTTSSATASTVSVVGGQITAEGPVLGSEGGRVELSDIQAATYNVAAKSIVGSKGGRIYVVGDSNFVGDEDFTFRRNNRLWVDQLLGGWW